jgi:copper transport protein
MKLRRLLALLALLVLGLGGSGSAYAHATLVASHPAAGMVLQTAPERLQLQFNEPISVSLIRLVDAAGRTHSDLTAEANGPFVSIVPPKDLPKGTQVLSYRIVSEDGHPVGGSVAFSIGAAGTAHEVASQTGMRPQVLWALRLLVYICVLGGVGTAFFRAWIAPVESRRRLMSVLVLGFLLLVASLGVQGLDILDDGWAALFGLAPWEAAAVTSYGVMVGLAASAILCAAASLSEPRPRRLRLQTAFAVLLVGAALASTGHAATAPPQWLMRPAVLIHVVGVTIWAGALAPLYGLTYGEPGAALQALKRFSALAIWGVLLLVAAGVTVAVVQVESIDALVQTDYGRLLVAKLVAVAGLLALAALNRFVLTAGLGRGDLSALRRFRLSIGLEIGLMVCVAGLVAGWRFTPPPRNLLAEPPTLLHLHGDKLMVMVSFSPGRIGSNRLQLEVLDPGFIPFDSKEVTVALTPADGSLEPQELKAKAEGGGIYQLDAIFVPKPGLWHLRVGALVTDFERTDLETDVAFNK